MENKKEQIIQKLQLEPHREGGYFRETYKSSLQYGNRHLMTTIYYMVTDDGPLSQWHSNKSDHVHFHHQGGRLKYLFIDQATGLLQESILSSNILEGEYSQVVVPGNSWKTCLLMDQEYALISEAVSPGFSYEDSKLITGE